MSAQFCYSMYRGYAVRKSDIHGENKINGKRGWYKIKRERPE